MWRFGLALPLSALRWAVQISTSGSKLAHTTDVLLQHDERTHLQNSAYSYAVQKTGMPTTSPKNSLTINVLHPSAIFGLPTSSVPELREISFTTHRTVRGTTRFLELGGDGCITLVEQTGSMHFFSSNSNNWRPAHPVRKRRAGCTSPGLVSKKFNVRVTIEKKRTHLHLLEPMLSRIDSARWTALYVDTTGSLTPVLDISRGKLGIQREEQFLVRLSGQ